MASRDANRTRRNSSTGQKGVVDPADVNERCERRAQHHRGRAVLGNECDHYGRSKRLSVVHEAGRIDIGATEEIRARGSSICHQTGFGRRSPVPPVPPVVEQQHLVPVVPQHHRQRRPVCAIGGVTVEDDDGTGGSSRTARHEPATEYETVRGRERHRFDLGKPDVARRRAHGRTENRSAFVENAHMSRRPPAAARHTVTRKPIARLPSWTLMRTYGLGGPSNRRRNRLRVKPVASSKVSTAFGSQSAMPKLWDTILQRRDDTVVPDPL